MNLILLEPGELSGARATLFGRRALHIRAVHRAVAGQRLRVGVLGGQIGQAEVAAIDDESVVLDVELGQDPPPPVACTLVLALPRPRVLHRVLGCAAAFGIKRIALFGSRRVEKSYWQSPVLGEDSVRRCLLEGLEQAGDTMLPLVSRHLRFRPFVEDELGALASAPAASSDDPLKLVADAAGARPCPRADGRAVTLVVGPEGGLIDFELDLLATAGFEAVSLGARPLRVEHAFAALLGRLF